MSDIIKFLLLGFGGYLLYEKFFAAPSATATSSAGGSGKTNGTTPTQQQLIDQTKAGMYGPQGSSTLIGPPLDLRNGLVACWLGSQTPPKGWDASANPSLSVADWDNLETSCISPGAKAVGGTQSVTADDYVNLRISGNLGLQGLGVRRNYVPRNLPMSKSVRGRGRNLTPGTPRRRFTPVLPMQATGRRNYVPANTPMRRGA